MEEAIAAMLNTPMPTSIHIYIPQGKQKEVAVLYQTAGISTVSSEILFGPQKGWDRKSMERIC